MTGTTIGEVIRDGERWVACATHAVGIALLFRLLIRVDAEAFLYLLLAVGTQWNGVLLTAGAAGVCLLMQWLVAARGRRS